MSIRVHSRIPYRQKIAKNSAKSGYSQRMCYNRPRHLMRLLAVAGMKKNKLKSGGMKCPQTNGLSTTKKNHKPTTPIQTQPSLKTRRAMQKYLLQDLSKLT